MQITYELTIEDIVNFNLYHFKHSKIFKKKRIILRWLIPIWVIVVYLYLNFDQIDTISLLYNIPVFLFGIVWYLFSDRFYFWRLRSNVKKMLQDNKNNGMLGRQTIDIKEDLFKVETDWSSSQFKLGSVNTIVETDQYLFLYLTSIHALIIPVNIFKNDEKEIFLKKMKTFISLTV
ncbi:YcxB family protein [Leptospira sp. WS92.C1]